MTTPDPGVAIVNILDEGCSHRDSIHLAVMLLVPIMFTKLSGPGEMFTREATT